MLSFVWEEIDGALVCVRDVKFYLLWDYLAYTNIDSVAVGKYVNWSKLEYASEYTKAAVSQLILLDVVERKA